MCTYTTENIQYNKKAENARRGSRDIFSWLSVLHRLYIEQQIPRPESKERRKEYYSAKKKRHTVKNQLVVNNSGLIIHKLVHKKGRRQ